MSNIKNLFSLDNVSTEKIKSCSKIIIYINLISYGFIATYNFVDSYMTQRIYNVSLWVMDSFSSSWFSIRSVSSYIFLLGMKEDNLSYMIPILMDAISQLCGFTIIILCGPIVFINHKLILLLKIGAEVMMNLLVIFIPGNYYRRLLKGNLENPTESQEA